MSRNSRRTQVPKSVDPPEAEPQPNVVPPMQKEKSNPFGLSFAVETEIVHLPSGGNFYDEGSALNGIETVEIKAMTAKEEDILINESFIGSAIDLTFKDLYNILISMGINCELKISSLNAPIIDLNNDANKITGILSSKKLIKDIIKNNL